MRRLHSIAALVITNIVVIASSGTAILAQEVRVWQKQELTFTSERPFQNPYTDVRIWVDLKGPGFDRRVYGFWDGGNTFRVRVLATTPGRWTWASGSEPRTPGLSDKAGAFVARDWTEAEQQANPLRRGFLRPSTNHHALETADGTPFFVIGDTWYSAATNRFRWYDDDTPRSIGPDAGFKDYVRLRKSQGYNWVNIIAAFPNWDNDGQPWHIVMNNADHTTVRSAWLEFGTGPDNRTGTAKNMKNEGGRPFLFPGKVPGYENIFPDVDRINPEYFKYMDRKIDYLNEQGFVPFIEVSRRDASECWMKYYNWKDSYSRFIEYVFSRYQANNTVLSPIHLDIIQESITIPEFLSAIDAAFARYGRPPFGNLLSANANPSTLVNWGEHSWVTLQQTGNKREHEYYWYLTQIFRDPHPEPGLDGEPYYAGYVDARGLGGGYKFGAQGGTPKDDRYVRSAMYGNVLSGGLAGHVYGAEGIWGADIEPSAPTHMWDAFNWHSGAEMQYLAKFILSLGKRYADLVPDQFVVPSQTDVVKGYDGWAYAARTQDQAMFLAYFEKGCPKSLIRGAKLMGNYHARWFNPRTGEWTEVAGGSLSSNNIGEIDLPAFPSDDDWALSLTYEGAAQLPEHF
ncbi:MAG: DUF4038 domain-containing protein [Acidobacteriaceae bacterium]|nr:DUF4038 domain-containing protein [Acidobacteriaceae bacterium]